MGAKGDGGLLAVLDLRADESLQEAGFAREVPTWSQLMPCTSVGQTSQPLPHMTSMCAHPNAVDRHEHLKSVL